MYGRIIICMIGERHPAEAHQLGEFQPVLGLWSTPTCIGGFNCRLLSVCYFSTSCGSTDQRRRRQTSPAWQIRSRIPLAPAASTLERCLALLLVVVIFIVSLLERRLH